MEILDKKRYVRFFDPGQANIFQEFHSNDS